MSLSRLQTGCLRHIGLVCLALLAAVPSVLLWPMDALTLRDGDNGQIVLRAAMPPGRGFATAYIHSVQLSPVEDEYFAQDGLIRQWLSRGQGHNTALPDPAQARGRVYIDQPWIVFQGTTTPLADYVLRVGNEHFGRNHLRIGQGPWQPLYRTMPGKRLHIAASRCALYRLWPHGTKAI